MWRSRQAPKAAAAPACDVAREDYRTQRLAFVGSLVELDRAEGLEIGAFDLATVLPHQGRCEFADWRSEEALASEFQVPSETLTRVTYALDRARPLPEQIPRRFDYVILCHVLEHVPDPIGFLADVAQLVRAGGVIVLAVPDKRHTRDGSRASTTIDQLLARHYHRETSPSLTQIMEFARAWSDDWEALATRSPREFYDWAVKYFESGRADAHCNVWQDTELFAQLERLIEAGFLADLELKARGLNMPPFNEFYVALEKRAAS